LIKNKLAKLKYIKRKIQSIFTYETSVKFKVSGQREKFSQLGNKNELTKEKIRQE